MDQSGEEGEEEHTEKTGQEPEKAAAKSLTRVEFLPGVSWWGTGGAGA